MVLSELDEASDTIEYCRVDVLLLEINPKTKVYPLNRRDDYNNYYLAHVPKGRPRVGNFEQLVYPDLYTNIDLMHTSNKAGWKFYYIIKPGGLPSEIEFAFAGNDSIYISNNNLIIGTALGNITFPQGEAYQISSSGTKISLGWQPQYSISGTAVNFTYGSYDTSKPLVFEVKQNPTMNTLTNIQNLEWSTFYGEGNEYTSFFTIETNASNNIWMTGATNSDQFPAYNGQFLDSFGQIDAVLIKFHNDGERHWATYYGGSDVEHFSEMQNGQTGLIVDYLGNSYIAGGTWSDNIPIHALNNEYVDSINENKEVFIAEFNSTGALLWSTYFGIGNTWANFVASYDVKLDNYGNLYVTGIVPGIDTINPLPYSGDKNTFIAEFNPAHQLIWSTYYGGSEFDYIRDIAFDSNNNMYIVGETESDDFPTLDPGNGVIYQDTLNGTSDAFIAKFKNNIPDWAMYLGGDSADIASGIAIDNFDNIYLSGITHSTDFPTINMGSPAYYKDSLQGNSYTYIGYGGYSGDGFIYKFSNIGERLHGTYYGGTNGDGFSDIEVDDKGYIYVTGSTASSTLPFASPNLTNAFVDDIRLGEQDGILLAFDSDLKLQWTTYFGGYTVSYMVNQDWITGLTITNNNKLFIVGESNSRYNYPWVESSNTLAWYDTIVYQTDAFIANFDISDIYRVENTIFKSDRIIVYPNPTSSTLYVKSDKQIDYYKIYSITGQLVKSGKYKSGISTLELSAGIYLLNINVGNKSRSVKFIKN